MSRNSFQYLLLLFLLGVILLFTGCSNRSSKKIIIWSSLRPVERQLFQKKLEIFSKHYPSYEFAQLFYNPEELRTNFIISALAGKGPAMMHCPSDFIGPLSELEVIKPLQNLFEPQFLDSFLTKPFPANTYFKNNLYQIADRIGNHLCLVYNKELLPTPPRKISELIALHDKFVKDTDGDGKPDSYVIAWNFMEPYFAIPFIGGYGGWILDPKNNPTLNTPQIVKAFQLISDIVRKYKITPRECDYETANALFLDRRVPMIINGPWSWGTYINNGIDLGLARIPMIDETGMWPTPMVSPMGFVVNINEKGERLKITTELIRFLTNSDVELEFSEKFSIIPSRKDALNSPLIKQNELLNQALGQLMVGRLMPVVTELRWIWDAMRPSYQAIFTNRLSPKQAAEQMQKLAEKLITENRD